MVCDRKKVRQDLMSLFGASTGRAKVTLTSYLDLEAHWTAILESLFRHNEISLPTHVDVSHFCVVGLFANKPDHGVVLGNSQSRKRLIVLNTSDVHFDPCLRLSALR